jgi:hypothetical protein
MESKMNVKLLATLICLACALPVTTPAAAVDDITDGTSAPSDETPAPSDNNNGGSSFNQCDPACVAPEECCVLSGLESACLPKDDCFAKKGRLLRPY